MWKSDSTSRGTGRAVIVLTCVCCLLGVGSGQALAAAAPPKPTAHTGAAVDVSYATATLAGSIDPRKSATYYYFQYGPTDAYGAQTPLAEAGAGDSAVPVRVAISGLAPLTIYHYRLVAVNAAGTTLGGDRELKTTKVPLSLQIVSTPDPVAFGGAITVQGTLSGTGNVNREVVLQANAFPFTAGFANVGNPELTSATGSFSFALLGLGVTSQFRVVTTTQPAVVSPVATESVTVLVSASHAPARRRHRVRIEGTVTPAENGMPVRVMRLSHGHEIVVGSATLQPAGPDHSSYRVTVHRRPGVYRVYAAISGAQSAAYSGSLLVR
jgi:hypothetical protein